MKILGKLRMFFRKDALDAEMAEEMRLHVELQTERNVKAGMNHDEARYAALRQFGNVASLQEQARDRRGWVWLEQLGQDVRYAFRQLARSPGFTLVVVLTLALGIGATTAIYSVVNAVILNPLGGTGAEQLILIGERKVDKGQEVFRGLGLPAHEGLQRRSDLFADLAWYSPAGIERQSEDDVRLERGAYVSWNFFGLLGTQPIIGRSFRPEEAAELTNYGLNRDTPIIISYDWWQTEWAGNPDILGHVITQHYAPSSDTGPAGMDRHYTVIGVMPPHFQFPEQRARFWLPFTRYAAPPGRGIIGIDWFRLVARLKPGTSSAQTQAALDVMAGHLMTAYPQYASFWRRGNPAGLSLTFRPLSFALQSGGDWTQLHRTVLGLLAAVVFLLLIVCANVANLALARVESRKQELAVRAALGAGSGRLMRQLLTENLLLAALGGLTGLLVTRWTFPVLLSLSDMPRMRPVEIDLPLLGFMTGIATLTGIAFSLVPAWQGGRVQVRAVIVDGGANATRGRSLYRDGLVIAQVGITVVLLTGAGLMLASVNRLLHVDPGFNPENLLTLKVTLPSLPGRLTDETSEAWRAKDTTARATLVTQLQQHLGALPGVKYAGLQMSSLAPSPYAADGRTEVISVGFGQVGLNESDPFRAIGVPLISGRWLSREDARQGRMVLINEAAANALWPGESAVGKRFRYAPAVPQPQWEPPASVEVVGVVGDIRLKGYASAPQPMCYYPYAPLNAVGQPQFYIRSAGNPRLLIAAARHEMKTISTGFRNPLFEVAQQTLFDSTLAQRTYRNYLLAFAGVGLLLAMLGVYGVQAYTVACRTREIGIRLALGADRQRIMQLVLGMGMRLIGLGAFVGLVAAYWLTKLLEKQLFDVEPHDLEVQVAVIILLALVGLFACWLPARRAAQVDPVVALRAE